MKRGRYRIDGERDQQAGKSDQHAEGSLAAKAAFGDPHEGAFWGASHDQLVSGTKGNDLMMII
jgi:hypothetical protein